MKGTHAITFWFAFNMEYKFMLSGLCLQTKPLRVTRWQSLQQNSPMKWDVHKARNCGCSRLCHKQKLAKSYHHPCTVAKLDMSGCCRCSVSQSNVLVAHLQHPLRQTHKAASKEARMQAHILSWSSATGRRATLQLSAAMSSTAPTSPQSSQIKIFTALFTPVLPFS